MSKIFFHLGLLVMLALSAAGCGTSSGNLGNVMMYKIVSPEPDWIHNGEPIEFESDLWYPIDTADVLLDTEVMPVGEYKGMEVFVQKLDVRPYNRIYTKFDKNKFRVFESRSRDDQSRKAL